MKRRRRRRRRRRRGGGGGGHRRCPPGTWPHWPLLFLTQFPLFVLPNYLGKIWIQFFEWWSNSKFRLSKLGNAVTLIHGNRILLIELFQFIFNKVHFFQMIEIRCQLVKLMNGLTRMNFADLIIWIRFQQSAMDGICYSFDGPYANEGVVCKWGDFQKALKWHLNK